MAKDPSALVNYDVLSYYVSSIAKACNKNYSKKGNTIRSFSFGMAIPTKEEVSDDDEEVMCAICIMDDDSIINIDCSIISEISGGGKYSGTASITVGGIKKGDSFTDIPIPEMIDKLINPYVAPSISIALSPTTSLYEVGTTVSGLKVRAIVTKNSKEINKVELFVNDVLFQTITEGVANGGSFEFFISDFSENTKFEVKVSDENNTVTASKTISFVKASYYGIVDNSIVNADIIKGLNKSIRSSKAFTYNNITMSNKFICLAHLKSFGTYSTILDGNNMDVITSFKLETINIDGDDYYAYTLKDSASLTNGVLKCN